METAVELAKDPVRQKLIMDYIEIQTGKPVPRDVQHSVAQFKDWERILGLVNTEAHDFPVFPVPPPLGEGGKLPPKRSWTFTELNKLWQRLRGLEEDNNEYKVRTLSDSEEDLDDEDYTDQFEQVRTYNDYTQLNNAEIAKRFLLGVATWPTDLVINSAKLANFLILGVTGNLIRLAKNTADTIYNAGGLDDDSDGSGSGYETPQGSDGDE
jgi:hypothetical protein